MRLRPLPNWTSSTTGPEGPAAALPEKPSPAQSGSTCRELPGNGGRPDRSGTGGRKGQRHLGALPRLAARGQPAAVRLGEFGRDGQADAGTRGLRRLAAAPEPVEDV